MTNDDNNTTSQTEIPVTRFDFTKPQRNFMLHATTHHILDAIELGVLIAQHGANFEAIADDIIEAAFLSRHHDGGADHKSICEAYERLNS